MEGWRASLDVRASLTHPPDYPSSAPTQKVTYVLVSRTCQVTLNEWLKFTLSQECLFSDLLKIRVWERNVYLVTRI